MDDRDEKRPYELPRVTRLHESTRKGLGYCAGPGSGDSTCQTPGNSALSECQSDGASAQNYCTPSGSCADFDCTTGSNWLTGCGAGS